MINAGFFVLGSGDPQKIAKGDGGSNLKKNLINSIGIY